MKITSFFILFTFLFSYQGEIVSIEFMDFMNIEDVQNDLDDTFGSVAPEAQYDISIYKIIYKTIDPFGEETNASGIISFPHNIDEAFTHAKNGWIYVTSSNQGVPRDLLSKMNKRINIEMKPLTVVKPYDDINGMIIQTALFKFLNGNRTKMFDDGSTDNRLFLDKIEDMSAKDGSRSLIEWNDFYGS